MDIECLAPAEALARLRGGAVLVDVREDDERALGMAQGALGVSRGVLEAGPGAVLPDRHAEVLLICQRGARSVQAARALAAAGYTRVASVEGGTARWRDDGLPLVQPSGDADFIERYARHLRLPGIGLEGQRRLEASRVLLVGAGGLGSPAGLYLAAAGVGALRLVDDDTVDRSNLQRQVLHAESRLGARKVDSATVALSALNPRTRVEAVFGRATPATVEGLLEGVDVVLDGSDNFATRYLLNDACVKLAVPLVYGAVHRFEGQASVFDAGRHRGIAPCYRCLFPEPPPAGAAPDCAEAGVLGVLPGVVGLLQATEAIKLLLGIGDPLRGRLLHFDALGMRFRETRLPPDPDCAVCAPGRPFPGYQSIPAACAAD